MKTIITLLAILQLIFLSSCMTVDDSDYLNKPIQVAIKNLIVVETKSTYNTNDVLYFNVYVPRYIKEEKFVDLLDIFKTSNNNQIPIGFNLEKKTAYNTWSRINIGNNYILDKGQTSDVNYPFASCVLNNIDNLYEFRLGIKLLEQGEFKLNINEYLSCYPDNNNNNDVGVNIITTYNINDSNGKPITAYNFTVN